MLNSLKTLCSKFGGQFCLIAFLLLSNIVFSQNNGLYKYINTEGNQGFIDKYGTIKIKAQFLIAKDFKEGLCFVSNGTSEQGYKWICIDTLGNKIYDSPDFPKEDYSQGLAILWGQTGYYFVDKKGKRAFDNEFQDVRGNFSNGYAVVSNEKFTNYKFIDLTGKIAEHLPSGNITVFNNGLSTYFNAGQGITIFDISGKVIAKNVEAITDLSNKYIKIQKNEKWGFIDRDGNVVIDFVYEQDRRKEFDQILKLNVDSLNALPRARLRNIGFFNDGLAMFQRDGLWGFINIRNEIVIEPKFKKVGEFSDGLAGASVDGKLWGFINQRGDFVIKPTYFWTDRFVDGICAVRTTYEQYEMANDYRMDAIIDKSGTLISQQEMHCYMG